MKIYVFAALLLVAASHALPVEEESADVYIPLEDVAVSLDGLLVPQQEEVRADRQRRITCDLLTWGGKVGDSACAANCLSMGKAGGRCIKSICTCRKTKLSDLWKKRFGRK